MLIASHRHTPADLAAWARLEHYDDMLSRDGRLEVMAAQARAAIEAFAASGTCYAGFSGGKDSVILAHLVATSAVADTVPLAWARAADMENPDSGRVLEALRERHPHLNVIVRDFVFRVPLRGEPGFEASCEGPGQDAINETLADISGGRYISGVRAAESGARKKRMLTQGISTARTCAPIGWWETQQVFAALARWDLPVHPAYAMSAGGTYRRDQLRVHSLGGDAGTGFGRDRWEDAYYGDVLAAARAARAPMWA